MIQSLSKPRPARLRGTPPRADEVADQGLRHMLEALEARMSPAHRAAFLVKMAEMEREQPLSPATTVLGHG